MFPTPAEGFAHAKAVFTGKVLKSGPTEWTVEVNRVWKGEVASQVIVFDALAGTSCAADGYKTGESYLFLANVASTNGTTKYSPQVCNYGPQLKSSKMSLVPNGPLRWVEDWVLMGQGKGKLPALGTNGRVEGQTRDFLGAVVPKAIVVFRKGDFKREVISDESGEYQIDLPAGVYEVTVEKFNIFNPFQRKNVKVQNGKLKKLDVVLKYDVKKHPPVTLRDDKP